MSVAQTIVGKVKNVLLGYDYTGNSYEKVALDPVTKALLVSFSTSATNISLDTTNFNTNLSSADDTVQKALETLDELVSGGGSNTRTVSAKTANYTVTSGESNTLYTNEGASGEITFTLPTAVAGLTYEFYVQTGQNVIIATGAGDTIRYDGSANTQLSASTRGNCIQIVAINNTEWITEDAIGTWTVGEATGIGTWVIGTTFIVQ